MSSTIEELYIHTRNHPVCGYLISLESVLAYPIPFLESDTVYLKFIVYQRGWAPSGSPKPVYPPHARLTIEYPSGRLVEYLDLTQKISSESVGEYPHPTIANLSIKEILAKKADFFSMTEAIIPLLGRTPINTEELGIVNKYTDLANTLIEPSLRPFYRELNPALFKWLDAA